MVGEGQLWWLSIIIALLSVAWLYYQPRPSFVVPSHLINHRKKGVYRSLQGIIIVCISLLPLQLGRVVGETTIQEKTLNIQIIYDVSISMAATDIAPSRFEAAKQSMFALLDNLQDYRIGMIAFAGKALVHMPFSDDTQAMSAALQATSFAQFPPTDNFQGTAMGDAILLALKQLQSEAQRTEKPGIIILLTDGDANVGISPLEAASIAGDAGVPIYTLGIGTENQVLGRTQDGTKIETTINLALLESIALQSNGTFFRVITPDDFTTIFDEIAGIVKDQEYSRTEYTIKYLTDLLLIIIIVCSLCLGSIRYRGIA